MHRLEQEPTVISWTKERKILVGHHDCDGCGQETPHPTHSELLTFAQNNPGATCMWPADLSIGPAAWTPTGWESCGKFGLLCPRCIESCKNALNVRRGIPEERQQLSIAARARLAVDAIEQDILDRRGLKREWREIDLDVKLEIRRRWTTIITNRFIDFAPKNEQPPEAGADTKSEG